MKKSVNPIHVRKERPLHALLNEAATSVLRGYVYNKVRKKAKIRIQSSSTPDPEHHNGKVTKTHKNKKRAKRPAFFQQVTTRLHETDKAVWQRKTQIT